MLQRSILLAASVCAAFGDAHMSNVIEHPVYHIVEEPGAVEHMADCEVPTEEYYTMLAADVESTASQSVEAHAGTSRRIGTLLGHVHRGRIQLRYQQTASRSY